MWKKLKATLVKSLVLNAPYVIADLMTWSRGQPISRVGDTESATR